MSKYNLDDILKGNTIALEDIPAEFWELDNDTKEFTLNYYLKYVVRDRKAIKLTTKSPVKGGGDQIYPYFNSILEKHKNRYDYLVLSVVYSETDTFDISIESILKGETDIKILHCAKYTFNSVKYHVPTFMSPFCETRLLKWNF